MDALPPVQSLWIILLLLLFVNFLLTCAEHSTVVASDSRLKKLSEDGNLKAERLIEFLDGHSRMLKSSMQFLNTLLLLCVGMCALLIYFRPLRMGFEGLRLAAGASGVLSFIIIAVLTAMAYLITAVSVPKGIAGRHADSMALFLSPFTICVTYACMPFVCIPSAISAMILKIFGVKEGEDDEDVTEEEIRMMVDIGSESGVIDDDEKEMIHNIFEMDDKPVEDIMTHRTDAVILWLNDGAEKWEQIINETNHTRYPVCGNAIDDVLGIINSRDFYRLMLRDRNADLKSILRDPYFIPESIKADELFSQMQTKNAHFAIVLDEYGGFRGIITQEDLIEEIVGELYSEYEEPEAEIGIHRIPDTPDTWIISGSAEIEDVEEELGIKIPDEEYNTFAGLILDELGTVPADDETPEVTFGRMKIKVTRVAEHRIEEAIVTLTDESNEGGEAAETDAAEAAD